MNKIAEAMKVVTAEIKNDPGYRIGWQANIAVAFQDEFARQYKERLGDFDIHDISNKAANNFLNILCREELGNEHFEVIK